MKLGGWRRLWIVVSASACIFIGVLFERLSKRAILLICFHPSVAGASCPRNRVQILVERGPQAGAIAICGAESIHGENEQDHRLEGFHLVLLKVNLPYTAALAYI